MKFNAKLQRVLPYMIVLMLLLTQLSCDEPLTLSDNHASVIQQGISADIIIPPPPIIPINFWFKVPSPYTPGFGEQTCSFVINNKAYLLMGYTGKLWEYDPTTATWIEKGDIPAPTAYSGMAFGIGGKGYFLSLQQLWEYDPLANTWIQKSNFPGRARSFGVAFVIGDKGYVGSGTKHDISMNEVELLNDFWEYDPATNQWIQKANIPGGIRSNAVGVSTATRGYIGNGHSYLYNITLGKIKVYLNDWWEYNPDFNSWTRKANYPGAGRTGTLGFTLDGKPYVGIGLSQNNGASADFWRYNPATNQWLQRKNFGSAITTYGNAMTSFAVNGNGYFVLDNLEEAWKYWK